MRRDRNLDWSESGVENLELDLKRLGGVNVGRRNVEQVDAKGVWVADIGCAVSTTSTAIPATNADSTLFAVHGRGWRIAEVRPL